MKSTKRRYLAGGRTCAPCSSKSHRRGNEGDRHSKIFERNPSTGPLGCTVNGDACGHTRTWRWRELKTTVSKTFWTVPTDPVRALAGLLRAFEQPSDVSDRVSCLGRGFSYTGQQRRERLSSGTCLRKPRYQLEGTYGTSSNTHSNPFFSQFSQTGFRESHLIFRERLKEPEDGIYGRKDV